MKLDGLPLGSSYTDDDEENLTQLLKTFGSVVSLEDIASAYCESGRNLISTVEMLSNAQGSTGTSLSESQNDVESVTSPSSRCKLNNESGNAHIGKLKGNSCSAMLGSVSGIIGKDYSAPRSQAKGLNEKAKPVILHSEDFPASEIWDEKKELASTSSGESIDADVQEFLFKMLGNGFQLDMDVIQDVLGKCGYNMPMSIDRLLDMSAATLEKSDDVIGSDAGNAELSSAGRMNFSVNIGNDSILPEANMNKKNIEREILEAVFSVPSKIDEKQESTVPVRPARRLPHGEIVSKPFEDKFVEDFTFLTRQPVNDRTDETNESGYEDLRKAVKEYWGIMKEYYKAAMDAFLIRDYKNADRLMEEGNFFKMKAREADEKSAQKLFDDGDEEDFCLNMHYLEPKDALQNLQLQLTYFSGLPSISHMKVVVGTGDGDKKDVKRKRLITRLLEKEGIPWTEEGNGWTISIRVDKIDPTKLSFANK